MISPSTQNPEVNEEIVPLIKDLVSTDNIEDYGVSTENETSPNDECITEIIAIVKKYQLSPTSLRYVFKRVRELTKLTIPSRPKTLPKYFTPAEAYHLMETARQISPSHSLLVQLLIQTGLRISETRSTDLRDIHPDNNTLVVLKGKGRKDRIVPIGSSLAEKIFLFTRPRNKGSIFVHKKTMKPLSVRRLQQMVNEVSQKAGFGTSHPHRLRHTYACILINKGFSLEDVQLFMGHSSKVTTEVYAKIAFTPEQKERYLQLFP